MPLRLEIKKELSARSDRVKSVDIHSSEVRAPSETEGEEKMQTREMNRGKMRNTHSKRFSLDVSLPCSMSLTMRKKRRAKKHAYTHAQIS